MPGYPCCCRRMPGCGDCQGTAPEQYQLTVPSGTFYGGGESGGTCGESCADFNGVYLLDYNPDFTNPILSDVTCVWESATFDACYLCLPANPETGEPAVCFDDTWFWRVELSEETGFDGKVRAYVFLRSLNNNYLFTWTGEFVSSDCGATLNLSFNPDSLQNNGTGCHVDQTKVPTLEPGP